MDSCCRPLNTYNNKAPFKARVKSVERIVGPKATGETCHIIIESKKDYCSSSYSKESRIHADHRWLCLC